MASLLVVLPPSAERDKLVEVLAAAGHKIALADDKDALQTWRRDRHELVIADESLGALDLAQKVRAETSLEFVPLLAIVTKAESRVAALALVDDATARPLDLAEMAARVQALLRTRKLVDELRAARAESESRTLNDPATGLHNRVFLNERLTEEWKRAARYNEPLSLLILSVDGLHARPAPLVDRVLNAVAQATVRSLRQIDVITRFGGTELAALLPNTHFAGSIICAERLFREVARTTIEEWPPVVTMGVAFYPGRDVQEPADLLKLATRALDRAREEGPGSICLVQHQGYLFQPKKQ